MAMAMPITTARPSKALEPLRAFGLYVECWVRAQTDYADLDPRNLDFVGWALAADFRRLGHFGVFWSEKPDPCEEYPSGETRQVLGVGSFRR